MSGWLLLPAASTSAEEVDRLLWFLLAIGVLFTALIAVVILILIVRYRRRPGRRRGPPSLPVTIALEVAWTALPLGIAMLMFVWAGAVYVEGATVPRDAEEVLVVGRQWMWKLQHANGAREIDELHVPLGRDIKLVMTSEDVIHSFYVPAFRTKMDVLPGRYTYLWFKPTQLGSFRLFCAEFCGTQHSRMTGRIVVLPPEEYERWLIDHGPGVSAVAAGATLFVKAGCPACHRSEDANRAPALETVYGSIVRLADGRTLVADEEYLRESIVDPAAKVVAGYTPIMPAYTRTFSPDELLSLVAYIKSLGSEPLREPDQGALDEAR